MVTSFCLRVIVFFATTMVASSSTVATQHDNATARVGFGTAALGESCANVVYMALEEGFRAFDTAEADWWYDQAAVGRALEEFFSTKDDSVLDDECLDSEGQVCQAGTQPECGLQNLRVSTKIPPWSLTSTENIRRNAANSRRELVGFCRDEAMLADNGIEIAKPFPLDIYYIHAPTCWKGWHPRCDDHPPLLPLRESWLAMEAVVGLDYSARRIGLSNIRVEELVDLLTYIRERIAKPESSGAPPRIPDVVQAFADPIQPADDLRRVCQENGIEFVSYSTLGTQHRNVVQNPVLRSPIVQHIAVKHERSTAEVVLSWALHHNMGVIPRSSQRTHIRELARLLNKENAQFLDETDIHQIDSMKNTL